MMKLGQKFINYQFRVTRKAKIYKRPIYSGIPDYHKPHFIDIHDTYQKRTKEEVMAELHEADYKVQITKHLYSEDDFKGDHNSRKVIPHNNLGHHSVRYRSIQFHRIADGKI